MADPNIGKVFSDGLSTLRVTGVEGYKYTVIKTGLSARGVESLELVVDRELISKLKEQGGE